MYCMPIYYVFKFALIFCKYNQIRMIIERSWICISDKYFTKADLVYTNINNNKNI